MTQVICGLCGNTVKLNKSGAMPEHLRTGRVRGLWRRARCNGLQQGLTIAKAAHINTRWIRGNALARLRALRFHWAGKSMENDAKQQYRLKYLQQRIFWR